MKEEDIQFCLSLIGKPWVSGASGPDSFDCWGLLRYVLRIRRNIKLSPYGGVKETGLLTMIRSARIERASNWKRLLEPVHFCGVGMGRAHNIEHVGLWVDEAGGGIFHCYETAGVVFQKTKSIRALGFQHFSFYEFSSSNH